MILSAMILDSDVSRGRNAPVTGNGRIRVQGFVAVKPGPYPKKSPYRGGSRNGG